MARSHLNHSEVKRALQKKKINFKLINDSEYSDILTDESTKDSDEAINKSVKQRENIFRSFNEGEVYQWPLPNQENIEKLIDISNVWDDLCIYLTIDHDHLDITLKNIVHDQNFIYESRCFDKKRLHAEGICCGFSNLHEKSLSWMNLCEEILVISRADSRTVVNNFDNLVCERKSRFRLNEPEMCMVPVKKEGEFNSIKADVCASGTLMFDMLLAHNVLSAIVGYKPEKVIDSVNSISLDLLQSANAGLVVSVKDLARLKRFLKGFFRHNPHERIILKHALFASFLQYRSRYIMNRESHQSVSLPKDSLILDFCNLNWLTRYLIDNFCFNSISQTTQKRKVEIANIASDASTIEAQQIGRRIQFGENITKIDVSYKGYLKNNVKIENQENLIKITLLPSYKAIICIPNAETIDDFQRFSRNLETVNADIKAVIESNYNCYQSKSPTFIKSRTGNNTIAFNRLSRKICHLNNKPSIEYDLQNNDVGFSYNKHDNNECENDSNNGKNGDNSVTESDLKKEDTGKRISENTETGLLRNETQIRQCIPFKEKYSASVQIFEKPIVNLSQQIQKIEDTIKDNVEHLLGDEFDDSSGLTTIPDKSHSYSKAIENENYRNRKFEINYSAGNKNLQKGLQIINFKTENRMKRKPVCDKINKRDYVDVKMKEMVTKCEKVRKNPRFFGDVQYNTDVACPEISKDENGINKLKRREIKPNVKVAKSSKIPVKNKVKEKTEMKPPNKEPINKTVEIKNYNRQIKGKSGKKEKNLCEHKKLEKLEKSWFPWF